MTRNWLQLSAAALIGAALIAGPAAAQKKYSPGRQRQGNQDRPDQPL